MKGIAKIGLIVGGIAVLGGIGYGVYKMTKKEDGQTDGEEIELGATEINPIGKYATLKSGKSAMKSPTTANTNNPTFSMTGKIGKVTKEVEGYSNTTGKKDGNQWYLIELTTKYQYKENNIVKYAEKVYVKKEDVTLSSK